MTEPVIKSIAGTDSGLIVEYRELLTPNRQPRFWNGRRVKPTGIVIHTAECGEVWNAAESLAEWDAGSGRPKGASWNAAVANIDISVSVPFDEMAWHAGPVNAYTIGLEHAGKASQSAADWDDEYSHQQLILSSMLVAVLCEVYQIPVRRVSTDELKSNHHAGIQSRGILGHHDVTIALGGTHVDPGPDFPWDRYLKMVQTRAVGAPDA